MFSAARRFFWRRSIGTSVTYTHKKGENVLLVAFHFEAKWCIFGMERGKSGGRRAARALWLVLLYLACWEVSFWLVSCGQVFAVHIWKSKKMSLGSIMVSFPPCGYLVPNGNCVCACACGVCVCVCVCVWVHVVWKWIPVFLPVFPSASAFVLLTPICFLGSLLFAQECHSWSENKVFWCCVRLEPVMDLYKDVKTRPVGWGGGGGWGGGPT